MSRDDWLSGSPTVNQPSETVPICSCQDPLSLASVLRLAANQHIAELLADTSKYMVP